METIIIPEQADTDSNYIKTRKALKTALKLKQIQQSQQSQQTQQKLQNYNLCERYETFDAPKFFRINMHIVNRNSRKHITTIEGIPAFKFMDNEKTEKFLLKLRNAISARATLKNKLTNPIIEYSGDNVVKVIPLICDFCSCDETDIVVHGSQC